MIGELIHRFHVRELTAVLKRVNQRSQQMLLRLGFVEAALPRATLAAIDADEILMTRNAQVE